MTNHTAPAIAALTKPTGILVAVRRSKTDQDGHGQLVGVARGQHRQTDPIGALEAWLKVRPRRPRRSSPGSTHPEPPPPNASAPERSADSSRTAPTRRASRASPSPGTPFAPGTPPRRRSTAPRSNGSPPRPATATSARCSTTTSAPPKRSRPAPAATSDSEPPRSALTPVQASSHRRDRADRGRSRRGWSRPKGGVVTVVGGGAQRPDMPMSVRTS